jgi:hypothetical protein
MRESVVAVAASSFILVLSDARIMIELLIAMPNAQRPVIRSRCSGTAPLDRTTDIHHAELWTSGPVLVVG